MEIYGTLGRRVYQHAEHLVVFLRRYVHSLQVGFDHVETALRDRRLLAAHDGEVTVLETVEHAKTQRPVKTPNLVRKRVLEQAEKHGMNGFRKR